MQLIFDSNKEFEYFQFFWYALEFAKREGYGVFRLRTEELLRHRLAAISKPLPDGIGRILKEPCMLNISTDEKVILIERLQEVDWQPGAKPMAKEALRSLLI